MISIDKSLENSSQPKNSNPTQTEPTQPNPSVGFNAIRKHLARNEVKDLFKAIYGNNTRLSGVEKRGQRNSRQCTLNK